MIRPNPIPRKCMKCSKKFIYRPKSDALNPLDAICPSCKAKAEGYKLVNVLNNIFKTKK